MAIKLFSLLNSSIKYTAMLNKGHYLKYIFFKTFSTVQNAHFEYFQNNGNYKESVVQRNSELNNCKIAGPELSLVKEHDVKIDELFAHLSQRENVMKLSTEQVKDVMCLIANMETDLTKHSSVIKYLDEKCALGAERWPLNLSLYILDAWFIILGSKAFRKHYYSAVTSMWSRKMSKATKNHIVQMLFFIGLSKSRPPFLMEILEDKMESFSAEFLDEEWAITLLSFFKTSKKISSQLLLSKACQVAENFLIQDKRHQLISVLKCLRHAQFYDEKLWRLLKDYIKAQHESFNFVESTNFLAAFAAQNVYEEDVYKCLEVQGMKLLLLEEQNYCAGEKRNLKNHPSGKSRAKDLARFLWSITSIGHCMKNETVNDILKIFQRKIDMGEFQMQSHILVDCMQSLALAGCYPHFALKRITHPAFLDNIIHMERDKPRYQFYFVQKCAEVECPELRLTTRINTRSLNALNPIPKVLHQDVNEREGFQDMIDLLKCGVDTRNCNFRCCYVIPHIMIAGIVVSIKCADLSSKRNPLSEIEEVNFGKFLKSNIISRNITDWISNANSDRKYICIEILDPTVCIRDSFEPLGLMKTKIRQLRKMSFYVVTVSSEEIKKLTTMTQSEQRDKIASLLQI